jgi:signal transduction histidine kinase
MVASPIDPADRLLALESYGLLDPRPDSALHDFLLLAAHACRLPFAVFSTFDGQQEHIKATVGIETGTIPVNALAGLFAADHGSAVATAIADASHHDRLSQHGCVTGAPHIRAYCGVPICGEGGVVLGALAVADSHVAANAGELLAILSGMGRQLETLLELRKFRLQRDALAAFMVHDLKNPLAALHLNAEFCVREVEEGSVLHETLSEITGLTQTMERLLRDIGDVARDGRTLVIHPREVRLARCIENVKRLVGRRLQQASVTLEMRLDPQLEVVELDGPLFERLMETLIDFAITRSAAGAAVQASITPAEGGIECRVTDSGNAIEGEARRRLFLPRPGLEHDATKLIATRRFGMAFCRLAVEAQHGQIWAENLPERGMAFCVRLPCRPVEPHSTPRYDSFSRRSRGPHTRPAAA